MNLRQIFLPSIIIYLLIKPTKQNCNYKQYRTYSYSYENVYELHCTNVVDAVEAKQLEDVIAIDISESNIPDLKYGLFRNYTDIKYVTMAGNNITNIDSDAFHNLNELQTLNLTNNFIGTLSGGTFNNLQNLRMLDLSKNNISTIGLEPLDGLESLIGIYLANNNISNISPLLAYCQRLEHLDISHNYISQIELMEGCSNLEFLYISHNQLIEFNINTASMIKVLDLSWNSLSNFNNDSLKNMDFLTEMKLSNNPLFQIHDIPFNLFYNKTRLIYLNLSATGIRKIIAGIFASLTNLNVLDLSWNYLEFLPANIFDGLVFLYDLNLSNNRFTVLQMENYPKLSQINLSNNMWSCETLSSIIKKYRSMGTRIVLGHMYNSLNILGVGCIDSCTDSKNDVVRNQSQKWVLLSLSVIPFLINFPCSK